MPNDRAFLDVEDDERRQRRIGTLLEQLNITTATTTVQQPKPVLDIGRQRAPDPIELPDELIARVQAFLPAISASNLQLAEMEPEEVDIENISDSEERYIEMNLGLGVFESKHRQNSGSRAVSPSSESDSGSDATSSESESDSESSRVYSEEDSESYSSSDDDADSDSHSESSVDMKPIFSRIIKPLPRRAASQQPKMDV